MGNRHLIAIFLMALMGFGCDAAPEGEQVLASADTTSTEALADTESVPTDYELPIAVIYEPVDGQVYVHGEPIELVGKVGGSLDGELSGGAHWVSDLEGVIWDGVGNASGIVTWTWEDASPGLHAITLLSIDSMNEVATTTVSIFVNDVPSPPEIAIHPSNPTTADDLEVSLEVLAQDANKSDELTYEYRWYRSGQWVPEVLGNTVPSELTHRGETWKVAVTVTDGHHQSEEAVAETTVENAPPSYEGAAIIPEAGGVSTDFTCAGTWWNDPDGDMESAHYLWEINGQEIASEKGPSLTMGLAKKGDWIRCGVTPYDAYGFGETLYSETLTLGNTLPVLDSTDISPKNGDVTTVYNCSHGEAKDPDTEDTPIVETRWFLDGEILEGSVSLELSPQEVGAKGGQTLRCQGVPTDGFDDGIAIDSQVIVLGNATPEIGSVTVLVLGEEGAQGNLGSELSTLACQAEGVVDPDGDEPTMTYQWLSGDDWVIGPDNEYLQSETLDGFYFNKGEYIRCYAVVNDGSGATVQKGSSNSIAIMNTPPSLSAANLSPLSASKNTELTCSPGEWMDVDPMDGTWDGSVPDPMDTDSPAVFIAWYANGELIDGVNTEGYTPSAYPADTAIQCKMTPYDGEAFGEPVWSEMAVLINHAPSVATASLQPTPAYGNTTLECVPGGWEDPDGDMADYLYAWKVNDSLLPFAQGAHLPPPWFVKGDTVQCLITPWDGALEGEQIASVEIEIQNQPPALSGVKLTPEVGGKKSTFMCLVDEVFDTDPEDVVTFDFSWYLEDGTQISGEENASLSGSVPPMNEGFYCQVIPYDGTEHGSVYTSDLSMVVNAPPTLEGAVLTPEEPTALSTLECAPDGFDDPDGDEPVYEFKWFRNNVEIPYEDEGFLSSGIVKNGDVVFCQVTPGDGIVNGLPVISNAVTVLNAAPSAPGIKISPLIPLKGDALQCEVVTPGVDVDGDALTYETFWLFNGTWQADGPTIGSEWTDECGTWTCGVLALDGLGGESPPAIAEVEMHQGSALELEGNDGVVVLDVAVDDLPLAENPITVEFWAKPGGDLKGVLFEAGDEDADGAVIEQSGLRICSDDQGHLTMELWSEEASVLSVFSGGAKLEQSDSFVHVAATYDGEKARVWLNGELASEGAGQMPVSFGYGSFDGVWVFGGHDAGTGGQGAGKGGWSGVMDELRVSKINRYPEPYTPPTGYVIDEWTLALFNLDEGTGDVVLDAVGNLVGYLSTGSGSVSGFVPGLCSYLSEAPSMPDVTVLPLEPTDQDALVCQAVATDPEEDELSYSYSWLKNGVIQSGLESPVVSAGLTGACESWTCQVVASDGSSQGPVGDATVYVINSWEEETYSGFDATSGQSWYDGFAQEEMFGVVFSFPENAYPVVVKKAYVHVAPYGPAKLHVWSVDNPDDDGEPLDTYLLDPGDGSFFSADVGLSLMDPTHQFRVGVESTVYEGLSVPYRESGSGLHLVKTCDSLIPDFGCLLDAPTWKPASAFMNTGDVFWEIHVEVETAGGGGYCE